MKTEVEVNTTQNKKNSNRVKNVKNSHGGSGPFSSIRKKLQLERYFFCFVCELQLDFFLKSRVFFSRAT